MKTNNGGASYPPPRKGGEGKCRGEGGETIDPINHKDMEGLPEALTIFFFTGGGDDVGGRRRRRRKLEAMDPISEQTPPSPTCNYVEG